MKIKNLSIYILLITVLLVALPLIGCTGNAAGTTTAAEMTTLAAVGETTSGSTGAKNEVMIESNAFKPDSLTIKVGDTVTWINNDSYNHTVTAKTGEFNSGDMANGAKFSFTFNKEGTYDYTCSIHTFMTGKIIVTK
jgi:plastocyanin